MIYIYVIISHLLLVTTLSCHAYNRYQFFRYYTFVLIPTVANEHMYTTSVVHDSMEVHSPADDRAPATLNGLEHFTREWVQFLDITSGYIM